MADYDAENGRYDGKLVSHLTSSTPSLLLH